MIPDHQPLTLPGLRQSWARSIRRPVTAPTAVVGDSDADAYHDEHGGFSASTAPAVTSWVPGELA